MAFYRTMEFDPQPVLRGRRLSLRPLRADDRDALWQAARDPLIWELHPDKSRCEPEGFARFFDASLASGAALVIVDNAGRIIGSTRYYEVDLARREMAIGYTFLVRDQWGGEANAEMKRLLIEHAAPFVDTIWFHVGAGNLRSRRAMEKIGGQAMFEGPRPLHGNMVDFVYYRIQPQRWLAAATR